MTGKKPLLLLAFVALGIIVQAQNNHDTSNYKLVKMEDSLKLKKLSLEVENLENDNRYYKLTKPLTIIGSFFGLFAIFWTIFQGLKTIKLQSEQQRQSKISTFLSLLNDEKPEKRASGANGLTRYPGEVYQEVLAALKIEQVEYVREILEEILLKLSDKEFNEVIKANRETIINRTRLLGSLGATGEKIEITEALLGIYPETRIKITADFRYFFDQGVETARYQLFRASQIGVLSPNIKEGLINQALQAARVAHSTSKIISKRLLLNPSIRDLSMLDLNLANLYKIILPQCNFSRSIVTNSICRHADFSGSDFTEANFNSGDMYDCKLDGSTFCNSSFNDVSLRSSTAQKIDIKKTTFIESVLSQSDMSSSKFEEVDLRKSKIKGVILKHSKFSGCNFSQAELEGTNFHKSTISDSTFFGCVLTAVNFSDCDLSGIKFNGADLSHASFTNCILKNVDFSGADLKNLKIDGWHISDCIFNKVKNFNTNNENNNGA